MLHGKSVESARRCNSPTYKSGERVFLRKRGGTVKGIYGQSAGLFGGTVDLFRDLEEYGITTKFVTHMTADEIEKHITDKIRVIYGELIGL